MVSLRISSDWHTEFWKAKSFEAYKEIIEKEVLPPSAEDAETRLILAGDIFVASIQSEDFFKDVFPYLLDRFKQIIYVTGNHEAYGWHSYPDLHPFLRGSIKTRWGKKLQDKFKLLDYSMDHTCDRRVFWGGTFWTDFDNDSPMVECLARNQMNDYRSIGDFDTGYAKFTSLNARHLLKLNVEQKWNIKDFYVVTHHAPSFESCSPEYKGNPINGAYANNMENFILENPRIKLWVHGHIHSTSDYMIGECKIVANPFGYRNAGLAAKKNTSYNPSLFLTI